jgi:hypothetical protein
MNVITGDSLDNSGGPDLGPFHGDCEQHAQVFTWFTLALSAGVLLFPWFLAGMLELHHPLRSFRSGLPTSIAWLSSLDALGLILMLNYHTLYRRLSARIAVGGPDAVFLDGVRHQVAALGFSLLMLLIVVLAHPAK